MQIIWHSDQTCPVRCQWTHKSLCTKCTVAVFVVYLVCSSLLTAVCKSFFFSSSIPARSRFLTSYWKHFHSAWTLWRISDYQPRGHWNTGASRRLELRCSKSLLLERHVDGGSRRSNVLFRIEMAIFFLSPKHQRLPCPSQRRQTTFSSITSRSTCNTWGHVQVFQSVQALSHWGATTAGWSLDGGDAARTNIFSHVLHGYGTCISDLWLTIQSSWAQVRVET